MHKIKAGLLEYYQLVCNLSANLVIDDDMMLNYLMETRVSYHVILLQCIYVIALFASQCTEVLV